MIRALIKNVRINSIRNVLETQRYAAVRRAQEVQQFYTSNSEYQHGEMVEIEMKIYYSLFSAELNHGEFEWQDPKSENEV